MVTRRYSGWLLEVSHKWEWNTGFGSPYYAWVSNAKRMVCGFGKGGCAADAVRAALYDAAHHYAKDCDALTGLEAEYFGPTGAAATAANANSGQ